MRWRRREAGEAATLTGRTTSRDDVATSFLAVLFTAALGLSSVALPLRALDGGLGAGMIGGLVALSALVQIVTRSRLGVVMRRVPDRTLLTFAPVALAVTFLLALIQPSVAALAAAWIVLALARACFWTAGQTHAVRGEGSSLRRLARLNFYGSIGALAGPLLAGLLAEGGTEVALVAGAGIAALAALPARWLDLFAPFAKSQTKGKQAMWRRPGVDAACWSGATAGAWRGLLDGFVPVVLAEARHSSTVVGALVSVANASAIIGTVLINRIKPSLTAVTYVVSMLTAALGLALLGYVAGAVFVAAATLALSGVGAGVLQTLGPSLAATSVSPDEKGDAMAAYGTVRTSAMFLAPLAVAGGVLVMPIAAALAVVGGALAVPALGVRSLRRVPGATAASP
jgi:MFS family permease